MKYFYSIYLFLLSWSLLAQTVGINSTGAVPATSAMLDIFAVDKGLLIPRVDIIDLNTNAPVSSPTTSLLVYNTNVTSGVGYYFWNGSKWINLKDSDSNADEDWYEAGTITSPDDINDDVFTKGKVGIGLDNPSESLHVFSNTPARLLIEGGQDGYINAGLILKANAGSNDRGTGVFFYDSGAQNEWYAGRPYRLTDRFVIQRKTGLANHGDIAAGLIDGSGNVTGTERFFTIMNDGKTGVGTITPSEKLDVLGNIQMRSYSLGIANGLFFRGGFNSSSNPYNLSITTDNFNGDGTPDALSINAFEGVSISTGHNTILQRRLTVINNGNVGIGLVSPAVKLHVLSSPLGDNLGDKQNVFILETKPTSNNLYLEFINRRHSAGSDWYGTNGRLQRRVDGTAQGFIDFGIDGASASYGLGFGTRNGLGGTQQTRMVISDNGNVGIGAISPNAPLEISPVNISAIQEGIRLIDEGGGSSEGLWIQFGQASVNDYARFGGRSYNNTSGGLYFSTKADADATPIERMRISPSGNVGLGTITPTSKLHIKNGSILMDGNSSQILLKASAGSIDPGDLIFVNGDGTNKARIWAEPSSNQGLQLNGSGNGTVHMKIDASGNVGVGVAPSYKFHVGTNSAAKPTSNTWTVASDRRLKTNIRSYEGGLDDLLKIDPVWFTYTGKAGMPKDTGVGIIAQDLQKIAPYMVNEWTYNNEGVKEKYLGVDNGAMTYMLINAVKELKTENDLLKNELKEIKELLKNLK